jgi:hypothetical protein
MEYDPATEIRRLDREERARLVSEKTIAAAFRRAVKLDMIPLALALLDADAEWTDYSDGQSSLAIFASAENFDALDAVDRFDLFKLFRPLTPSGRYLTGDVELRVRVEDVEPEWRRQAADAISEQKPVNQGTLVTVGGERYNGLRFRSYSEIVIAKELDSRGVLYFPLPAASRRGVRREPDFLIVAKGRVGILEVHGEPYHPATRAAEDHKRSLFFEESGIFVKVFDAKECRTNPKTVIDTFLRLLEGPSR